MALDLMSDLESCRLFLAHRAALPAETLLPYAGRWIAWSPEGERVVADAARPEELDERIEAAGEDPERCVIEGIAAADAVLGPSAAWGFLTSRSPRSARSIRFEAF